MKKIIILEVVLIFSLLIYVFVSKSSLPNSNKADKNLLTNTTITSIVSTTTPTILSNTKQITVTTKTNIKPTVTTKLSNSNFKTYINAKYNFSFNYDKNLAIKEWANKTNDVEIINELQILISDITTIESLKSLNPSNTPPLFLDKINIYINKEGSAIEEGFKSKAGSQSWTKKNYGNLDIWEFDTNMFDAFYGTGTIKLETEEDKMYAEMFKSQKVVLCYFNHNGYFYSIITSLASDQEIKTVLSSWTFSK